MVRNYVRKTAKSLVSTRPNFLNAMDQVRKGLMTQRQAAIHYGISQQNLSRHLLGQRGTKSSCLGRPPFIPLEMESRLAHGLKLMEKWGFGLSRKEVLKVVADFVKINSIVNTFKGGVPGEGWFGKFTKRHQLSIKKPQSVEYARKKMMADPFVVQGYFSLLKATLSKLKLENKPGQIWNLDETSFCLDPSKTKVVGAKGSPSSRTTAGNGKENTTILSGCNAAGKKAPPLIIFKGKNIWDQWMAPEGKGYLGTSYAATANGWMEADVFENYFERSFLPCIGKERPALLIYDGHSTHISAKIIELAMKKNVTILKLPPHTSHILQPLDLTVFKPMKSKWDQKIVQWQRTHMGSRLPKQMFSVLLGETWNEICSTTISNGFEKAGIYPFNSEVIPESQFDPEAIKRFKKSNAMTILPTSQAVTVATAAPVETQDQIPPRSSSTATEPVSFENLLLGTVQQSSLDKPKKKSRVCPGAEVITCEEALAKLSEVKVKPPVKARGSIRNKKTPPPKNIQMRRRPLAEKNGQLDGGDGILPKFALKVGVWIILKERRNNQSFVGLIVNKNHKVGQGDWTVRFVTSDRGVFKWALEEFRAVYEIDILKQTLPPLLKPDSSMTFPEDFSAVPT